MFSFVLNLFLCIQSAGWTWVTLKLTSVQNKSSPIFVSVLWGRSFRTCPHMRANFSSDSLLTTFSITLINSDRNLIICFSEDVLLSWVRCTPKGDAGTQIQILKSILIPQPVIKHSGEAKMEHDHWLSVIRNAVFYCHWNQRGHKCPRVHVYVDISKIQTVC